jgi:hypothetical protein
MSKGQNITPTGPFLVRTRKGSVLMQTTDQVREYLTREEGSVLEISSTVQKWKLSAEQARQLFNVALYPASTSQQLADLATRTAEISVEIMSGNEANINDLQGRNVKNPISQSPIRVKQRQGPRHRREANPIRIGILIGSGLLLALGLVITSTFMRSDRTQQATPAITQDPPAKLEPAATPQEVQSTPPKSDRPEVKTAPSAILKPLKIPTLPANIPVSDLIAINADHFGRRISWVGQFKDESEGAKPTIPCLMRVQNMAADDPFLWSSAILIYRVDRGKGLLLRIVEFIGGERDRRREYDFQSTSTGLYGSKTFVLEFIASTDLARGRVRMLVDDLPVIWSKLSINDIANPHLNQKKTISTTLISGEVPTLFSDKGRWIARGDSDSSVYTYTLTGNIEIPAIDP